MAEETENPFTNLTGSDADEVPAAESHRPYHLLYAAGTIAAGALFGGFLAGCLLLATNYWRLKKKLAAWMIALVGIMGTVGIFVALWEYAEVPARWGALLYLGPLFLAQLLGSAILMWALANLLQGGALVEHGQRSGRQARFRDVIGICLLCSGLIFFVQIITTYPRTWDGTGQGLEFAPNQELYYTDQVSKEQALRLGQKLREIGLFDNSGAKKTVVFTNEENCLQIRIFLHQGAWNDQGVMELFEDLRAQLAREVFADAPLEIVLCDQLNRPKAFIQKKVR